jgi:hypothetical protein
MYSEKGTRLFWAYASITQISQEIRRNNISRNNKTKENDRICDLAQIRHEFYCIPLCLQLIS